MADKLQDLRWSRLAMVLNRPKLCRLKKYRFNVAGDDMCANGLAQMQNSVRRGGGEVVNQIPGSKVEAWDATKISLS